MTGFISEEQHDHEDYKEPVKTQGHEEIDIGKMKKKTLMKIIATPYNCVDQTN